MSDLIIEKPNWQTHRQRLLFGSVTIAFWALWVYLWMPLLGFIGWLLGLRIAYNQMVVQGGYVGLLHLLGIYALIILGLGSLLLGWAYYNYFRFRGIERRRARPEVSSVNLCDKYRISSETLVRWSQARRLVLHHDVHGRLLRGDVALSA